MQRLLTGIQPSGSLHIGNYIGALKPFLDIYPDYESMLMVADYHALTTLRDPAQLRQNIMDIVKDYLAIGVEPKKAIIFRQSDVPEHTELAWILECLVTVPFLQQAHAYKDKVAKGLEANAGLFNYPMLMAADILLYDTDVVPTGEDQRQHIEYAREAAEKFNAAYGETFKEPKERILKGAGTVLGIDGKKMSKSYGNTIPLFGTKDEIKKAVMKVITDSGIAEENKSFHETGLGSDHVVRPYNLYRIHRMFRSVSELDKIYPEYQNNYEALKKMLIEDIESVVSPMRKRREAITDSEVKSILKEGEGKARALASKKIMEIRQKIGITL